MKRLTLLIYLLAACMLRVSANFNAPDFNFMHYDTSNGLPSNRVRDIVQDSDGFMWFATDGGLVRFDGNRSRVFVPEDEKGCAGEVFVMSLCRNGNGLLVGTDHSLYAYDSGMEKLAPFPLVYPDNIKERIVGAVYHVVVDSTGTIWVSVESNGIFRIEPSGEVSANYHFPEMKDYIGRLYVDTNDTVWAVSNIADGGVFRYDRNRGVFIPFPLTLNGQPFKSNGLALTSDSHGDFWLGTWENGLVKFNGRTGEAHVMTKPENVWNLWHIHSLTEFTPTMLLVGSDSGLTLVDMISGEGYVYTTDDTDLNSLSGRFVYPVTRDSDGGYWVGTFYRGVNYLSPASQRFQRWYHSRFNNSVSGNVVVRLCEDQTGNIWLGSADGGLSMYNPGTGKFRHYPLIGAGGNENVNALCVDGNRLWVGTYTKGVGLFDISSGKWHRIPVDGQTNASSYAICKDSKGRVWMAATETLTLYNPEKDMFEPVKTINSWINDIDEDHEGNLWISTQGSGLFRYNPDTDRWTNFVGSKSPGTLPGNHINSVKIDGNGNLYVATPKGLYGYLPRDERFFPIPVGEISLAAQSVEKYDDELWISTSSGLVCLKPDGQTRTYRVDDGVSDDQFMPGASLQTSDGKIYYGSVHGFCRVDPLAVRSKGSAPAIRFTGLDIVNEPVEVGDSHLPQSLNDIDKLVLTSADHTFCVYFSALSYANPSGNSYLYRLEGFDKTWHEAGKDNRATYSNLPPGNYTLHVKAANSDGIWNEEGIKLNIVVKPAWYASALMKALYVILGVALLLLIVHLIVKRMERDHIIELDRISSNKEKEMFRSKLSFFTIVAHEIRTPVSLIIGPLEKILDSSEKFSNAVKEDLHIIDRNARRLLSLVNQLLDFKKVEDNALPMGFRKEKVIPLIESVVDRFRPSVEHKGGTLTTVFPDPDLVADIDPEAVTKLVSNLLNNARKFTCDFIHVECKVLPDGKRFIISVADNGIGIEKENRDKIFKPFFQVLDNINESKGGTGLGLSIVKSVVDAHGGVIELESTVGKGSCFTVILPLHQEGVMPAEEKNMPDEEYLEKEEIVESGSNEEGKKPVLLVVDDNEEMVSFIASYFDKNYDVVTASNGKEALEEMKKAQVGLIICDWMMPVMDGVQFLKSIRENENYSHIPFVMLTAKTDNMSKIETMKSGADAYVEKPFSINYIEARIENLLEMRTLLRQKFSNSPWEPLTTLAPTQIDNELLTKIQKVIEDNISNPELSVDFIADNLAISRSGLYSKIKSLADVTPHELIQLTRLKKAAELLASGKYRSISEVSYMVGFSNSSYFSRCFSKQFGMKPAEFATSHKG